MRVAAALLVVCLGVRAARCEEFPYRAKIVQEAALIRSGPGENHYPTCRLLRGAEVEVYRHAPNGWCAVRPLEGEFSLVAAEQVRLLPGDDLAEVISDEAPVWIGSEIAQPEQHTWQIHLQRGERALVLGVRAAAGDEGAVAMWYKIAPPAGEFRWIPAESLAPVEKAGGFVDPSIPKSEPPTQPQVAGKQGADPVVDPAIPEEPPSPPRDPALPAESLDSPPADANAVMQASLELPIPGDAASSAEPRASSTPPPVESISAQAAANVAAPAFIEADRRMELLPRVIPQEPVAAETPAKEVLAAAEPFDVQFTSIQVELTLLAAQDLSRWRLGPLRDRATRLRAGAATAEERERAESLLGSIAGFEQLSQRYRQYAQARVSQAPQIIRQTPVDSGGIGSFFRRAAASR
jgi:hypothetical protein